MKIYKPNYGITVLYGCVSMLVCCLPVFLVGDIAMARQGQNHLGHFFLSMVWIFLLFGGVIVCVAGVISLIIGLFTRKTVELTEDAVTYGDKTLALHSIRYVTLHLPKLSRSSTEPQLLVLWADDKNDICIKRPSISLIVALKKRCPFAAFEVADWVRELKIYLGIQLAMLVLSLLGMLFGRK